MTELDQGTMLQNSLFRGEYCLKGDEINRPFELQDEERIVWEETLGINSTLRTDIIQWILRVCPILVLTVTVPTSSDFSSRSFPRF